MTDVVAIGELLIDFTTVEKDPSGYPTMAAHPGGAPANYLAALAKFDAKTAMLGKVGNDAFGSLLTDTLKAGGIDTSGVIKDDSVFTTLAFVTLDANGDRSFSFARKPGADTQLTPDEVNYSLIGEAKVLHFGTLSLTDEPARSATYHAVEYAKKAGKLISFDPNLRKPLWRDLEACKAQMLWGLQRADVVKISDEEVAFLFGMDPQQGAEYILNHFPVKLIFVTCGAQGCYYANPNARGWMPGLTNIRVADTTGAGDIFGGSAMWKLLQTGKAPELLEADHLQRIVGFACVAAGLSTTRPGGISSVPSMEEILRTPYDAIDLGPKQ